MLGIILYVRDSQQLCDIRSLFPISPRHREVKQLSYYHTFSKGRDPFSLTDSQGYGVGGGRAHLLYTQFFKYIASFIPTTTLEEDTVLILQMSEQVQSF